jgi:hypothetical protein
MVKRQLGLKAHMVRQYLCLSFVIATLLSRSTSHAAEPERRTFSLAAGVGPLLFVQERHAPPLCCGERDGWVAAGAQLQFEAGAMLGQYVRAFGGAGFAYELGIQQGKTGDRLRMAMARFGFDVIAFHRENVALGLGLLGSYGHVSGTFSRYPASPDAERALVGAGLRARLDLFPLFTERAGIAFDVGATKYMIVHQTWNASTMFVWAL